jgi:hypothetical protein
VDVEQDDMRAAEATAVASMRVVLKFMMCGNGSRNGSRFAAIPKKAS